MNNLHYLIGALLLTACMPVAPDRPSFGSKNAGGSETSNIEKQVSTPATAPGPLPMPDPGVTGMSPASGPVTEGGASTGLLEDGNEFSFASVIYPLAGGDLSKLALKRYLYVKQATTVAAAQRADLKGLCRDMNVVNESGKLKITWRSQYSATVRNALEQIVSRGNLDFGCVLDLGPLLAGKDNVTLRLDPMPIASKKYLGVKDLKVAIDNGSMLLIEEQLSSKLDPADLILTAEAAIIKPKVKAVLKSAVSLANAANAGQSCNVNAAGYNIFTATFGSELSAVQSKMQLNVPANTQFSVIKSQSTQAELATLCQDVEVLIQGSVIDINTTCGTAVFLQKKEYSNLCKWTTVAINSLDPDNSVELSIPTPKVVLKTFKMAEFQNSFAEGKNNPIRKNSMKLVNVNAEEKASLTKLFDIWESVSPATLAKAEFGKITATFTAVKSANDTCDRVKAAAYTPGLGGTEMFICPIAFKNLTQQDPNYLDLMATIFHENRHNAGRNHDGEDKSYQACDGAAQTGALHFDFLTSCKTEYCRATYDISMVGLKHNSEYNYSYNPKADPRKFQGACKTWLDGVGIKTPADYYNLGIYQTQPES